MIAGIQYNVQCKVAFGDKALAANSSKIAEELHLDPAISKLDALVLGPRDLSGINSKKLLNAVNTKHPDLNVIFIYTKDKDVVEFESDVTLIRINKVTADKIKDAVQDTLNVTGISQRDTTIISNDAQNLEEEPQKASGKGFLGSIMGGLPRKKKVQEEDNEEAYEVELSDEEVRALTDKEEFEEATSKLEDEGDEDLLDEEQEGPVITAPEQTVTLEELSGTTGVPIEERTRNIESIQDWDLFKTSLERDTIVKELLKESSEFAGAIHMLDVLDKQIHAVYTDTARHSEDKMNEIRSIALQRSTYKEVSNNMVTEKICRIMETIVNVATNTVDKRLDSVRENMKKISQKQIYYGHREELQALIEERLRIQVELHEILNSIINLYRTMDTEAIEVIKDFDAQVPTGNDFINEILKPMKGIFTPKNAATLANRIMNDLSKHQVSLSSLEDQVTEVVTLLFKLSDLDTDIITKQDHFIRLLQSQRVEDVIIADTILKSSLNLYVGEPNTGLHATTLTWTGILSRRRNTLVIDLTGAAKFGNYGMGSIELNDFMENRVEKAMLNVEGTLKDLTDLDALVRKMSEMVNYYNHINIILTADQQEYIKAFVPNALSINYVVNSTRSSIDSTRKVVETIDYTNIAKKLILIDSIDSVWTMEQLSLDPLATKLINVPHMSSIRECALRNLRPFDNPEIAEVFELAFR